MIDQVLSGKIFVYTGESTMTIKSESVVASIIGTIANPEVLFLISISTYFYLKKIQQPRFIFLVISVITYLILIFLTLAIGSKQLFLFVFMAIAIPYHYLYERIQMRYIYLGLIFTVLSFPLTYAMKAIGSVSGEFTFEKFISNIDIIFALDSQTFLNLLSFGILNRFHGADSLSLILTQKAELTFQSTYNFLYIFPSFIPRALWDEKPSVNPQIEFGHVFWGLPYDTQIPFTKIGELILMFGFGGSILFIFIGVIYKKIYILFYKDKNILSVVLYYFFIKYFVLQQVEATFYESRQGILNIIYISLIFFFLRFSYKRKSLYEN